MSEYQLPKHLDELRIFVEQKKPHFVCLNETKKNDTFDNEVPEINDYRLLRNDRIMHKGGVAMYLHKSVQFISRDEFNVICQETLSVEIKLPFTKPIILTTIYRPEATVEIFECINRFVDKIIISEDKEFILMDDMNRNMLGKPLDNTTKQIKRIYDAFGLTLLIKEPIRVTSDTQTLIDHAITNRPDLMSGSGVIPCGISDHDVIYIIRTARSPKI